MKTSSEYSVQDDVATTVIPAELVEKLLKSSTHYRFKSELSEKTRLDEVQFYQIKTGILELENALKLMLPEVSIRLNFRKFDYDMRYGFEMSVTLPTPPSPPSATPPSPK